MTKRTGQSFASAVRNELAHIVDKNTLCQKAELCALVQVCGSLVLSGGALLLRIETGSASLAKKIYSSIAQFTGRRAKMFLRGNPRLNRRDSVLLDLAGENVVLPFLQNLQIYQDGRIRRTTPAYASRLSCKRAYLRGLFLSCGSITNPERAYHMEWVFRYEEAAQNCQALLATLNVDAQRSVRKAHHVVYLKDSEDIARTLAHIGAHNALFKLENVRILAQVKNNVNRAVNCETANVNRTVDASIRQIACIEHLAKTGRLATLPAALRQTADARLSNPQASLAELALLLSPQVSKSCINHRLRRLVAMAEQSGFGNGQGGA